MYFAAITAVPITHTLMAHKQYILFPIWLVCTL